MLRTVLAKLDGLRAISFYPSEVGDHEQASSEHFQTEDRVLLKATDLTLENVFCANHGATT